VGNHEYVTPGASGYFDYYGAAAGERGKGYYSYDVGEWHLIVLNTNAVPDEYTSLPIGTDCYFVSCAAGSAQERWLRADLAANSKKCTLAYWHHPRFSSGLHGNTPGVKPLWDALYEAGADVVLSAHDHSYERFAPQKPDGTADPERGIRQFIVGTGGSRLYGFKDVKPNSEVRYNSTPGVIKLTLGSGSYTWEFIPTEGTFSDKGTGTCH
jgi:hypothetical protein